MKRRQLLGGSGTVVRADVAYAEAADSSTEIRPDDVRARATADQMYTIS